MNIWLVEDEYAIRNKVEGIVKNKYYTEEEFLTLAKQLWAAKEESEKVKYYDKHTAILQADRARQGKQKVSEVGAFKLGVSVFILFLCLVCCGDKVARN